MKTCPNCGTQLEDMMNFCNRCGARCQEEEKMTVAESSGYELVEPEIPVYEAKVVKKPRRKKAVAILCLVGVLLIAGVVGFFVLKWYFSSEQQLLRALEKGDFDAALEIVDEDSSLRKNDALIEKLQERIAAVQADYTAGTVEYAVTLNELDAIAEMEIRDLEDTLAQARAFVEKLNASRTAFATAESFFASGDYIEAIAQYKLVIQEDSNHEAAKTKSAEAVNLYRTKVLEDAAAYAQTGAYDNAITLLNAGLADLPQDAQLTQQIQLYEKAKADQILANALSEAAQYAAAEDYTSAITVLEQYISQHGENVDVGVALSTYKSNLSAKLLATALDTAAAYAQIGDYISAIRTLNTYTSDYGTNASVVLALNGYTESYVDGVLADAETSVNNGDYVSAIRAIRTAQSNITADRLTARLNTYTAAYEGEIIAQSDALLAQEDYDGAQAVVDQGLQTLPNSTALKGQSGKIEDARPEYLLDVLSPYMQPYNYTKCDIIRMGGEEYRHGFTCMGYGDSSAGNQTYFNVDGKYTTLTFTTGIVSMDYEDTVKFSIYADGQLVYSIEMKKGALPKHHIVDITGCKQLVFAVYDYRSTAMYSGTYGIAEITIN